MSQWQPADWATFFIAASPFVALLAANLIAVIKALKATTATQAASAENHATTNVQLATIATTVGAPVTIPPPTVTATIVPPPAAP